MTSATKPHKDTQSQGEAVFLSLLWFYKQLVLDVAVDQRCDLNQPAAALIQSALRNELRAQRLIQSVFRNELLLARINQACPPDNQIQYSDLAHVPETYSECSASSFCL